MTLIDDNVEEADETFTVTLSSPSGATISDATATGTIENDDTATLSITDPTAVTEGDSGSTNMVFTVMLDSQSAKEVTVGYAVDAAAASTATSGTDYTALADGTLTFAAETATQTVTVSVTGDELDESDETVVIKLSSPVNAVLGTASATGTITDDDSSPELDDIDDGTLRVGQTVSIQASATDADGDPVSYEWSRKAGETTPALPQGTTLNREQLTFVPTAAGTYTMTVTASDGKSNSDTEDVTITVTEAASVSAPATLSVAESAGNATVTITTEAAFGGSVTFTATLADGTATGASDPAGADFDNDAVSVTFGASDTTKDISIPITDDALDEGDGETFTATITLAQGSTLPAGFTLGNAATTVTITDDDASPALTAIEDVTLRVGQTVDITASATDADDGDTISYAWSRKAGETAPAIPQGTALNQAQLTFVTAAAGTYTMTVTASDGNGNSATEEVVITVSAAATVSVPAMLTVTEGTDSSATVRVTASAALGKSVTFEVSYGGTATGAANPANGDYDNDAVTSVAFGASDTTKDIVIPITDDGLDEAAETITVTIALAQGSTLPAGFTLGDDTTTVTITDNDSSPVLTAIEDVALRVGQTVDITASATDADDGDTISYAWTRKAGETTPALPQGTAQNQAQLTFVTTAAGTYTMTVTASDGNGNTDTEDVVITVSAAATVSAPATLTVAEDAGNATVTITTERAFGTSTTFNVTYGSTASTSDADATGASAPADGDYENDAVTSVQFGASDTTKDIVIPITDDDEDESAETFTVTIAPAATLPAGFTLGSATTTVTITDDDASPVLTAIEDVTLRVGQTVDITASATDADDGDTISYAWTRKAGETTPALPQGTAQNQAQLTFVTTAAGTYTMTVTASDGNGNSATEEVVITVSPVPTDPPARPTGFTAAAGNEEVKLTWDDPGGAGITWQFRQRKGRAQGAWTNIDAGDIDGSVSGKLSYTVEDLDNGAEYDFRIRGQNAAGTGRQSAWESATPTPPATVVPVAPTGFGTKGGNRQVTLYWTDPKDANITRWEILQKKGSASFGTNWTPIARPGNPGSEVATLYHAVTGLENSAAYAFKLRAVNAVGASVASAEATATPKAPAAATLSATAGATGEVTLNWTVADGDPHALVEHAESLGIWQSRYRPRGGDGTTTLTDWQTILHTRTSGDSRTANTNLSLTIPHGGVVDLQIRASGGKRGTTAATWGPWSNTATITLNDADDPRNAALTIVGAPVEVAPGKEATYTVALKKPYAGTLSIASSDTAKATVDPASLTFTSGNYETAQTVTVTGVEAGTATINHAYRLSGASVDFIPDAGTVSVTVAEPTPAISLSIADASASEDAGTLSFTVTASSAPSSEVTFEYTVTAESTDTAVEDTDFTAVTTATSGSIAANAQTATIAVTLNDDNVEEADETFTVTLSSPSGATISDATATGTIENDDTATLSIADPSAVTEGDSGSTDLVFTVTLDSQSAKEVTVGYAVDAASTVTSGTDYTALADGTLTFPAETGTKTITVSVTGDELDESDETVVIKLSNPVNAVLGTATGTGTITDDDASPVLTAIEDVTLRVGQTVDITASATDADDGDTISYAWSRKAGETALAIPQGTALNQAQLTFVTTAAGTYTMTVTASDGNGNTDTEDVVITVSAAATVSVPTTLTVAEDAGNATVTITTERAFGTSTTFNVTYGSTASTSDADATGAAAPADGDYENDAVTSVQFGASDTTKDIVIPITDDDEDESAETFTVTIAPAATLPAGFALGAATTTVTITDDDVAVPVTPDGVTVSVTRLTVAEGSAGTYTVKLNTEPPGTVTVTPSSSDTGAASFSPATLTFTAQSYGTAQTVTVTGESDTDGNDETVTISHAVTGYRSVSGGPSVTVSVTDGGTGCPVLAAPATPTVTAGSGQLSVSWSALSQNQASVGGRELRHRKTGTTSWTSKTVSGAGTTSGTITGLDSGAGYDVQLRATALASSGCADGVWSASATGTTTADPSVTEEPVTKTITLSTTGSTTVTEGDSGWTDVTVKITLGGVESTDYPVYIAFVPEVGTTGTFSASNSVNKCADRTAFDLCVWPSVVTFVSGETEKTFTARIRGDERDENNEIVKFQARKGNKIRGWGTASITFTIVDDDDSKGVTLSSSALTVAEGGSGSYTVKLNTKPSGDVTVTVGGTSGDVSVSGSPLTFTAANYAAAQTVTVNAAQDSDGDTDPAVTLTHSAAGGGYGSVSIGNVTVSVTEDDSKGVTLSKSALTVAEGGSGSYTVKLNTKPSGDVTVTVGGTSGDVSVSGSPLTFTAQNYAAAQTVTVNAAQDSDGDTDPDVTLTHSASGGGYNGVSIGNVTVSVTEDDSKGVTLSKSALTVAEGGSGSYTVKLNTKPSGDVTVTVGGTSGDVSVSGSPLTFTAANYAAAQTVTVNAAQDSDGDTDPSVTLTHSAAGGGYGSVSIGNVTVSVTEDDSKGVTLSKSALTVAEGGSGSYTVKLNTKPSGDVTVTVGGTSGDVSVSGSPLTFTAANYAAAQTVTVNAAQDSDGDTDPAVTLTHSAAGGGYGSVSIGNVTVSVTEDDSKGVTLSKSALTVAEGGSGSYTVKLNTKPSGDVTVTVGGTSGDVSVSGSPLTFTAQNYAAAQTVTVNAAQDSDGDTDPDVTLTHSASGGGYNGVSIGNVTVSVTEDDSKGVTLSKSALTVAEGGSGSYTVKLNTKPSGDVTVTVGGTSGDVSVSGSPLTFTAANYAAAQTVTVNAAQDSDGDTDPSVTLTHSAAGGGYGSVSIGNVTVSVTEDDSKGVTLSKSALTVAEGGSGSYTVKLNTKPSGDVTVTVGGTSGDVSVSGSPLTFTAANYAAAQTVTVNAAQDSDGDTDPAVTLTHSAAGGGYGSVSIGNVTVSVTEDDSKGVTLSKSALTVAEGGSGSYTVKLNTKPSGDVTVTVGGTSGDVSVSGSPLTFTAQNYAAAQTVTVNAAQDSDGDTDPDVTLTHSASGGGYNGVSIGNVTVSVTEDDSKGVTLSKSALTVAEGGSGSYTVKLNTKPSGDVTVTVGGTSGDVSVSGSPLTFTAANYAAAQTVTVNAAQDSDGDTDPSVTLTHSAAGGGYGSVSIGNVTVSVTEDDSKGVTLSKSALTVAEGGSGSYTVKLNTKPSGDVTVTVGGTSGDVSVSGSPLTFTAANYAAAQTVTVNAAQDSDGDTDPAVTLTHSAAGGGYGSVSIGNVTVSVTEDDSKGVTLSKSALTVAEGGSGSYTVKLNTKPSGDVTVTVGGTSGDVSVSGSPLTFTAQNYAAAQTVTVNAAQDSDGDTDPDVTLTHSASGGGYNGVSIGNVTVSVTEDDSKGVTLSKSALTVAEGGSGSYTVKLNTKPSGDVTVTVGGTSGDVSVSGSPLTFTAQNYAAAQTVTVNAAQDSDGDTDPSVTLTHSAAGGGYGSVSIGNVTVSVTEDDSKGVTLSKSALTVAEGGSGSYTVKLNTKPSGDVTVTVGGTSGDVSVSGSPLTFTAANYAAAQTVTVNAAQDSDGDTDPDVTLTHSASGGGYNGVSIGNVTVSVTEDDSKGVTLSKSALTVAEGGSGSYTVKLNTKPSGDVTVTVGGTSGDVSVSGSPLTFTAANYAAAQTVTVNAAQDSDGDTDPAVTLTHSAAGGGYGSVSIGNVTVSVTEDDSKGVTLSKSALTVAEGGSGSYTVKLNTKPSGDVTVTVGGTSGDVSVSGSPLTFTAANYAAAQTVTVNAAQDSDGDTDPAVTLTHSAAGGGYGSVSIGNVTVSVTEDDSKGVTLSKSALTVAEGGSGSYTVKLNTKPSGDVTVTVGGTSGDVSVSGSPLTFTAANYAAAQTVTVNAAQDSDGDTDPAVTLTHSAAGGGYGSVSIGNVTVSVTEDDSKGVTLSKSALTVAEGGSGSYTVKLNTKPSGDVTVTVGGTSGDVSVSGSPLTFTAQNYAAAQTVTVNAAQDSDGDTDADVTLTHTISGGGYGGVSIDDVTVSVTESTPVLQLLTDPAAVTEGSNIELTVTSNLDLSSDVTVSLTFADRGSSGFDADDIAGTLGPRTFTASFGESGKTGMVTIPTSVDSQVEGAETYRITLNNADGYALGSDTQADGTLNDGTSPPVSTTPAKPNVTATAGDRQVILSWGNPDDASITGYELQYGKVGESPGGWTNMDGSGASTVQYTVTNLENGSAYRFTIRAVNANGNGAASDEVTATPTAQPSEPPEVTATPGVTVSASTLTLDEGNSGNYTIVLDSEPAGAVTVTVSGASGDITASPPSLTFTAQNWSNAQGVTVSAAQDDDAVEDASVTLTHSASGGGYDAVEIASVSVSVIEDDTAAVAVTPTALTLDEGDTGSYTLVLKSEPTAPVTITATASTTDVTLSPSSLTFTRAGWNNPRTVTVAAVRDADDIEDASVAISHAVSGGDYDGVSADTVSVTVKDTTLAEQAERANRINRVVLPQIVSIIVSESFDSIAARIRSAASGKTSNTLQFGVASSPVEEPNPFSVTIKSRADDTDDPTLAEVLDGTAFTLTPGITDPSGSGASAVLWGRAKRSSFSGSEDGVSWDGELWSGHLGTDIRLRPDLLAGMALSYSEGEVDTASEGQNQRVESDHTTQLLSLHPYMAWITEEASAWGSMGYGEGELRIEEEQGMARRETDMEYVSIAAGAEKILHRDENWIAGGTTRISLKGEGSWSQVQANKNEAAALDKLGMDMQRLRVSVEGSHEREVRQGSALTAALEMGLRYDGGDVVSGVGLESGISVNYRNAQRGLTAEARAQGLVAHEQDRKEWGLSALVRMDPGADGRGIFLTFEPSRGETDSGMNQLFDRNPASVSGADNGGDTNLRLEAEVGYGFGVGRDGPPGVLSPYAGVTLEEAGERKWRVGTRYTVKEAFSLSMEFEQRQGRQTHENSLLFKGTLRW